MGAKQGQKKESQVLEYKSLPMTAADRFRSMIKTKQNSICKRANTLSWWNENIYDFIFRWLFRASDILKNTIAHFETIDFKNSVFSAFHFLKTQNR